MTNLLIEGKRNPLIDVLFSKDGQLKMNPATLIAPEELRGSSDAIARYIFDMLSIMNLDEEFIAQHIIQLRMDQVLEHNTVSEDFLWSNRDAIIEEIIHGFKHNQDKSPILDRIFENDYTPEFFDNFTNELYGQMDNLVGSVDEDTYLKINDNFTIFVNGLVSKFTREFILLGDVDFYIMAAAMVRDDISFADLILHIDNIRMSELLAFVEQYEELEAYDETHTEEKEKWVYHILSVKAREISVK
jgi:hypothetical protein